MKFSPAEPIAGIDGWRIKAEINGKLKEDGVMGMVQAIAEHQPRILIEQLSVSLQRGQTLRLSPGNLTTTEGVVRLTEALSRLLGT